MKSVKFIRPWSKYSPGDIAGFEEKQAQRLVDAKAAEHYSAEGASPAPAATPEPVAQGDAPAEPRAGRGARGK